MTARLFMAVTTSLLILGLAPFIGPALSGEQGEFILWQLRVPRTVMATMVGATLGLSGAVYQTLFSNPLATPSTVGTTAGAALGALIAIVLVGPVGAGIPVVAGAAFLGALGVTLFIASIAASGAICCASAPGSTRASTPQAAMAQSAGPGSSAPSSFRNSAPTHSLARVSTPSAWAAQAASPSSSTPRQASP